MSRARRAGALLALLCVSAARSSPAKDFVSTRRWTFATPAEALLESVVGYDKLCAKGCRYRAPHVKRAVILKQDFAADRFYVWTFVEDIQDAKWFSLVTVERSPQKIHVKFKMVPERVAARLSKETGKENDPAFDKCIATYDLEEIYEGGVFVRTNVAFTTTVQLSGLAAFFGASIIQSRLDEAAAAVYDDFRLVQPQPVPSVSTAP